MTVNIFTYLSILLMLLIAVPGRLAYGLCILLFLMILTVCALLFKKLVYRIGVQDMLVPLMSLFLVFMSEFLRLLLIFLCPVMALTMGYAVFMPAVSAFLLNVLYERRNPSATEAKAFIRQVLFFCLWMLLLFLARDVIGFGTVTLPAYRKIAVIHIIKSAPSGVAAGSALASIPGAFFIIGIGIVISSMIRKHNIRNGMLRKAQDEELENVE